MVMATFSTGDRQRVTETLFVDQCAHTGEQRSPQELLFSTFLAHYYWLLYINMLGLRQDYSASCCANAGLLLQPHFSILLTIVH
jgi:hypothetical protein